MNALAVLGIALLGVIVGIVLGVWLTSRRYERLLGSMSGDVAQIMERFPPIKEDDAR